MTADQATATADPVATASGTEPPRLTGPQLITNELIDAVANGHCGWTRKQLQILDVSWPPQSGWRQRIVAKGRTLSAEEVEALYAARKAKRPVEADPAGIPVLPCPWCSKPVQRIEHGGRIKEFCCKKHKTAFNNSLSKLSIATARLMRTPGALRTWAEGRVNPSPSGAEGLPRVTEGAGQQGSPSAPPRDETS